MLTALTAVRRPLQCGAATGASLLRASKPESRPNVDIRHGPTPTRGYTLLPVASQMLGQLKLYLLKQDRAPHPEKAASQNIPVHFHY